MGSLASLYQELPLSSKHDIRLLQIDDVKRYDETLNCSLYTASLEDPNLEYDVLSYSCGLSVKDTDIRINWKLFKTTKTLDCALKRVVRTEFEPIWVDQLSIHQFNEVEKSEQVLLMTEIYSKSRKCFCYLGEQDEDTGAAFLQAQAFHEMRDNPFSAGQLLSQAVFELPLDTSDVDDEWLVECQALQELLNRPYFSRRWIVQEIAVSKCLVGLCGPFIFNMSELLLAHVRQVLHWHQCRRRSKYLRPEPANSKVLALPQLRQAFLKRGYVRPAADDEMSLRMRDILAATVKFGETESRDYFFALLGMASDKESFVSPDYNLPSSELAQRFAEALVAQGYGFFCLERAHLGSLVHPTSPSWVPDWYSSHNRRAPHLNLDEPSATALTRNTIKVGTLRGTLQVQALRLGTVKAISYVSPAGGRSVADLVTAQINAAAALVRAGLDQPSESELDIFVTLAMKFSALTKRTTNKSPHEYLVTGEILRKCTTVEGSRMLEEVKRKAFLELVGVLNEWQIVRTYGEYLGLAPRAAQPGDIFVQFQHAVDAAVLREVEPGKFRYIGLGWDPTLRCVGGDDRQDGGEERTPDLLETDETQTWEGIETMIVV